MHFADVVEKELNIRRAISGAGAAGGGIRLFYRRTAVSIDAILDLASFDALAE